MGKKGSAINETIIANTLLAIFERLDDIEKIMVIIAKNSAPATVPDAVLREKLSRLTVKRHAVLTATLGKVSYQEIAKVMGCDESTVKLHLKAALDILGITSRSLLLASWPDLLNSIPDQEYEHRFGIDKRWWLTQKPALMAVLRATKPANNQHTT